MAVAVEARGFGVELTGGKGARWSRSPIIRCGECFGFSVSPWLVNNSNSILELSSSHSRVSDETLWQWRWRQITRPYSWRCCRGFRGMDMGRNFPGLDSPVLLFSSLALRRGQHGCAFRSLVVDAPGIYPQFSLHFLVYIGVFLGAFQALLVFTGAFLGAFQVSSV
uniref:Uncharacterized protein n=1 Tax=Oryza meridionalis TaxID=40149 RepID=A0A0E0ECS5_9ORYZ